MDVIDFIRRLQQVSGPNSAGEYMARCPAHEDRRASLCIKAGEKGVVLKCHAGCATEDVVKAMGLTMRDLFSDSPEPRSSRAASKPADKPEKAKEAARAPRVYGSYQEAFGYLGNVSAIYPYADEQGNFLYGVARIQQKQGKTFRQFRRVGAGEFPIAAGLPEGVRLVLYRLPMVVAAVAAGEPVIIVEGEKDADRLAGLGLCATTPAMGAGKWKSAYREPLKGASVYLIPDNDTPGREHMQAVAADLYEWAADVRVVDLKAVWPECPNKGDASDLLEAKGEAQGFTLLKDAMGKAQAWADEPKNRRARVAAMYGQVPGYCVDQGRICLSTQDGPKPLCNFVMAPSAVLTRDDGVNTTKEMVIEGWTHYGASLPQVTIKASQFEGLRWVSECWDFAANILPGTTTKDKIRYAVANVGDRLAKRVTEYTHTGWREINGKWAYLYQGGAIGADHVTVDLGSGLYNYHLSPGESDMDAAECGMMSLMVRGVMAQHVAVPLMATIYLAPLREFLHQSGLSPAYALFLLGGTGTRKSTILALAMSHFGDFTAKSLPASFNDTANFIRKKAFILKDMPIVVDDYHPVTNLQERKKMEATAQSLARAFGDGAERGRMKADLSLQEAMPPRGVAIISGEDTPGVGESGMARFYVVTVGKEDVPVGDSLTNMQEMARLGYLRACMRGYIEWLVPQTDTLPDRLRDAFLDNRRKAIELTKGQHGRTAEAIAHMMIGYRMMLDYMQHIGVLEEEDAKQQEEEAWTLLCESSRKQDNEMREERPSKLYLQQLGELMASGAAATRDLRQAKDTTPMNMIGYHDTDWYYLMPGVSYRAVARLCNEQGSAFPLTQKMLYRQMREDGILTEGSQGEGSATKPKWIDGRTQRLLWIPRGLIDGQREVQEEMREALDYVPVDAEEVFK